MVRNPSGWIRRPFDQPRGLLNLRVTTLLCAGTLWVVACVTPPAEDGGVDAAVFPDANSLDASTADSGFIDPDAGDSDGGCAYRVTELDTLGVPQAITPNGTIVALLLDENMAGSTSAFWLIDGGVRRLTPNIRLADGGLHVHDGGFQDFQVRALSDNYAVGTVFNSSVPQTTPVRMRLEEDEAMVLGDGSFGHAWAVNAVGTAVGDSRDDGHVWFLDGGVIRLGAYTAAFEGIDNEGVAAGWRRNSFDSDTEAFVRDVDGTTRTLSGTPPAAAGAVTATRILGGQRFWRRPSLELRTLDLGPWRWGGATVASRDGVIAGGAVGPRTDDPLSGYAAVWRDERLLWFAPHDPSLQIGAIVGVSSDGTQMLATCERLFGQRRPCRVFLTCPP